MLNKHSLDSSEGRQKIADRVTIYRRGKRWYANFQDGRRQVRISLKTSSKKTARDKALVIEAGLVQGTHKPAKRPPTIEAVTDAYLQHLRTERRAKRTIQKVELVIRRVLELAQRRHNQDILHLDLAFADAYKAERVTAEAMPKTVLNEIVIVRQIVNFALSRKLLSEDPLAGLRLRKVRSAEQPCWTRGQVDRIIAESTGWHRDALTMLAETGMRVGEAKWLRWDDVDFGRNVLLIRPKEGWKPKTGDHRAIPMSSALRQLLAARQRVSDWVLTRPRSRRVPQEGRQISERRLLTYLKRVLGKLGLVGHLHTFRHSFISHALTVGTPEAVVRNWVGHVDAEVMKLYTHIGDIASQEAMAKLAAVALPAKKKTSGPCTTSSLRRPGRAKAQIQHTRRRTKNARSAK